MYAIFKSGGKQYKVEENTVVKLEKLDGKEGEIIKLSSVLALSGEKGLTVGSPFIESAVVSAEVLKQTKDEKVIIFKKKRRQNYRRKRGHRQEITIVRILDVSGKGEAKTFTKEPKKIVAEQVQDANVAENAATTTDVKTEVKAKAKKAAPAKEVKAKVETKPKAEKATKAKTAKKAAE